jgi:uncharacterized protein YggU (UPF0235/DUF167 family)
VRAEGLSIEVAIAAPPAEGAANEELLSILAEALDLPKKCLRLAIGAGSKNKVVEISGLDEADVVRRLLAAI